jgi:hypothetical protein
MGLFIFLPVALTLSEGVPSLPGLLGLSSLDIRVDSVHPIICQLPSSVFCLGGSSVEIFNDSILYIVGSFFIT